MKTKMIMLVGLLAGAICANADNRLTVGTENVVEIPQGGGRIDILLENSANDNFTGFQMKMTLPEGITVNELEQSERIPKGNVERSTSGQITRIVWLNTTDESAISGTEGVLVSVLVTPKDANGDDLAVGTELTDCSLSDIVFAKRDDNVGWKSDDLNFTIRIVASTRIVLDENSTVLPEAATAANVLVKRAIHANEWSSICLPFAMSAEQVATAFGSGVEIGDFTGCTTNEEAGKTIGINVGFNPVSSIEANHPYIIKVPSAITEFQVNSVNIIPSENLSVDKNETKVGRYSYYNSFVGSLVAGTPVDAGALFLHDGKFYYNISNSKTMKAFHGYFFFDNAQLDDIADILASAPARILLDYGTTKIGAVDAGNISREKGSFYDLKGLPVAKPASGLYIKNGKKVVIK